MYPKGFLNQPFPYEFLAAKNLHVICTMSIEIVFAVTQWAGFKERTVLNKLQVKLLNNQAQQAMVTKSVLLVQRGLVMIVMMIVLYKEILRSS